MQRIAAILIGRVYVGTVLIKYLHEFNSTVKRSDPECIDAITVLFVNLDSFVGYHQVEHLWTALWRCDHQEIGAFFRDREVKVCSCGASKDYELSALVFVHCLQ